MHRMVLVCLVAVGVGACSGARKVKKESPDSGAVAGLENLDESFDPATVPEPEVEIQPRAREAGKTKSKGSSRAAADTTAAQRVLGFRIQLLQTEEAEEARKMQKDAILDLDTDVYVIYDEPYYKVRAGDFRTRYEAETFLEKVHGKGYTSAWIVRTIINPGGQKDQNGR